MQKLRNSVADIQNSEMLIRMTELGNQGQMISGLISDIKTMRISNNYVGVAACMIEVIKKIDEYKDYAKNNT